MGNFNVTNNPPVSGVSVQTLDANQDGTLDKAIVEKTTPTSVSRDSFNLQTPEGRQAFQQACVEMGISMPEFASGESAVLNQLTPEARGTLTQLSQALTESLASPEAPAGSALQSRWQEFVGQQAQSGGIDVNALVQQVLRESYMENTQDLYFYAEKVKFFNELKKGIREELTRARESLAGSAGQPSESYLNAPYSGVSFNTDYTGGTEVGTTDDATATVGRSADAAFKTGDFSDDWQVTSGRRWDPLAVDLDGDGQVSTIDASQGVFNLGSSTEDRTRSGRTSDMNVSGPNITTSSAGILTEVNEQRTTTKMFTEWFAPTEGILVLDDNDVDGIQGADLFGDKAVTGRDAANGYEDLARLDSNNDGVVDFNDDRFHELQIWQDKNSDGIAQEGELSHLFEHGIVSLDTKSTAGAAAGEDASVITEGSSFTNLEGACMTKADLETYIENQEELLNSVGDDAQLANVDLQNMLQKQQQTMQMMSNISKMLHDTAMAVIRKIG